MFFTVRTLRSALPRLRSVGLPPVYRTVNGVCMIVRLGSAVVRALDLRSTARGFDSWPPHCRVASDPGQVGHTCVPAASEVTSVYGDVEIRLIQFTSIEVES